MVKLVSVIDAIIILMFIVALSLVTASIYRRITGGIVRRKEERQVTKLPFYASASERIERKG